jgi:hypothetical protein
MGCTSSKPVSMTGILVALCRGELTSDPSTCHDLQVSEAQNTVAVPESTPTMTRDFFEHLPSNPPTAQQDPEEDEEVLEEEEDTVFVQAADGHNHTSSAPPDLNPMADSAVTAMRDESRISSQDVEILGVHAARGPATLQAANEELHICAKFARSLGINRREV